MRTLNERYVFDPKETPRRGGMAEVYRGVDMKADQEKVAIKMFRGGFAEDRLVMEAYSRECRSLEALEHPHIVKVIDGGTDAETGRRFLVLEWLEEDLYSRLDSNRLAGWDDFYEIVGRPVLDALLHAYSKEIVHRDLKPQNILYSADGFLKVVDFGISKFKRYCEPGLTLAGFRSEPYAPPEVDDGRFSDARDVYGFGVLAVECLTDTRLVSYGGLYSALDELDVPDDIFRILKDALSRDPLERPQNIALLFKAIESIQSSREHEWEEAQHVFVQFSRNALEKIAPNFPSTPQAALPEAALAELRELCQIRTWEQPGPDGTVKRASEPQFALLTPQYRFQAVIDSRHEDHLVVVNAFEDSPELLERLRESAWAPKIDFRTGRPPASSDGKAALDWFVTGLLSFEAMKADERNLEARERVFRTWSAILNAKQSIEEAREQPIRYDGFRIEGRRLHLALKDPPEDDLIGQLRLIQLPDGGHIAGEIDDVTGESIVLWTDYVAESSVPRRGRLLFDTRATRIALQRQRAALDAIRFGRSARPDAKQILLDPSTVPVPEQVAVLSLFQPDLDDDKQAAVAKALGSRDAVVVEGPPGTGKTRFIAELVLQTLRTDPQSRILLTSQTHVALDNALERIQELDSTLNLLRIGRRDDTRIAQDVSGLLLENRATSWLKTASNRSEAFLTKWAGENGVSPDEIRLGIAVARFRLARDEQEAEQLAMGALEAKLVQMQAAERRHGEGADSDTYYELRAGIDEATEQLAEFRESVKRSGAHRRQVERDLQEHDLGSDLAQETSEQLLEWEETLLSKDDNARTGRRLLELSEEWNLRFGRSADFYGALIADSQVVAGTCLGFYGAKGMQEIDFDLCIVDEASKATVTELLVPLSRARRWVLVGDRNQLPPFVESALEAPELLDDYALNREDLSETLLERLADSLPAECHQILTQQHRMVRPIGDLVSQCFYDGQLRSARDEPHDKLAFALPKPVTWFSTINVSDRREVQARPSFKNLAEVREIEALLRRIEFVAMNTGQRFSVAVLAGYAAQRFEIERRLAANASDMSHLEIDCNTVDAFQGREADIAIYSVTRCNDAGKLGFLGELRRLNVALSRGKFALAIVGDHYFCRSASGFNPFTRVLDHIESHPNDCALVEVDG